MHNPPVTLGWIIINLKDWSQLWTKSFNLAALKRILELSRNLQTNLDLIRCQSKIIGRHNPQLSQECDNALKLGTCIAGLFLVPNIIKIVVFFPVFLISPSEHRLHGKRLVPQSLKHIFPSRTKLLLDDFIYVFLKSTCLLYNRTHAERVIFTKKNNLIRIYKFI